MNAVDFFAALRRRDAASVRTILAEHPEFARATDDGGATALHYACEAGDREIVDILLAAGADMNARDRSFDATPAGWAIEYLRQRGALLATEIEDAKRAIVNRDADVVRRYLGRLPALRDAVAADGIDLKEHARRSDPQIARLFT